MIEWFMALPIASKIILGSTIIDTVAGWLPDRFTKWPGILPSIGKFMHDFGKEDSDKTLLLFKGYQELKKELEALKNEPISK